MIAVLGQPRTVEIEASAESGEAREIGATLANSGNVRDLRKAPHAEAKEEPGFRFGKRLTTQVVLLAVVCRVLGRFTSG